jgi:hypothetical protein
MALTRQTAKKACKLQQYKCHSQHVLHTLTLGSIDTCVVETRTDLDLHADQCAIGSNALVFHDLVHSNLRTVSAALAYDNGLTGKSVVLFIHQAILISDLDHNLLSTMKLRPNHVTVNIVPRFLTEKLTLLTHSLIIPTDNIENPYVIPMTLHGVGINLNHFPRLSSRARNPLKTHTTSQ